MYHLCNSCVCENINGTRCHEAGCPNKNERILLSYDGTLDTVFVCGHCSEEFRYTFDPSCETDPDADEEECEELYDIWVYEMFRELAEEHRCWEENKDEDY